MAIHLQDDDSPAGWCFTCRMMTHLQNYDLEGAYVQHSRNLPIGFFQPGAPSQVMA